MLAATWLQEVFHFQFLWEWSCDVQGCLIAPSTGTSKKCPFSPSLLMHKHSAPSYLLFISPFFSFLLSLLPSDNIKPMYSRIYKVKLLLGEYYSSDQSPSGFCSPVISWVLPPAPCRATHQFYLTGLCKAFSYATAGWGRHLAQGLGFSPSLLPFGERCKDLWPSPAFLTNQKANPGEQ